MRNLLLAGLVLLAACGGGDKGGNTTGPAVVASVQLNAPTTTIAVGATTTLTAIALDASGNSVTGQTVVWTSSSFSIASVAGGVVTGVAPGTATITATVGAKSSATIITVTAPISATCSGSTALSLAVGVVHVMSTDERSNLCISGLIGSEYVLIPFKGDSSPTQVSVSVTATGTIATTGAPTVAASLNLRPAPASSRLLSSAQHGEFGAAFESALRRNERRFLTPIANSVSRPSLLRSMQRISGNRSAILGLPATPAIGTTVQLNTDSSPNDDPCNVRINHTARVAAVSARAIIAVDSLAPAGGFTDADYAGFAATFDTLIFALDTAAFGAPADLDNNGRVLIFFTQTVNQLSKDSDNGYIGGFFYSRDLFPITAQSSLLTACPASNQGEMFYVPVVDAGGTYNHYFVDKNALQIELIGTLAHEFQHLINASRRLYVTQTQNWYEEVWLNEGMSHIAEELLYFHESGFAPKQNLNLATIRTTQASLDAINNYQVQNLARLESYLKDPGDYSAYAPNDSLATRGATYELLRYAMDLSPNANSTYLHALINSQNTGMTNFNAVFSATFPNIIAAVQQQVIANFFNDQGIPIDSRYAFPSWNYRDVIGNGLNKNVNPLATKSLVGATATTFTLTGGGAGYGRFRVPAGTTASIASATGAGPVPSNITMILIRTQ
jgi:hypothetical protein